MVTTTAVSAGASWALSHPLTEAKPKNRQDLCTQTKWLERSSTERTSVRLCRLHETFTFLVHPFFQPSSPWLLQNAQSWLCMFEKQDTCKTLYRHDESCVVVVVISTPRSLFQSSPPPLLVRCEWTGSQGNRAETTIDHHLHPAHKSPAHCCMLRFTPSTNPSGGDTVGIRITADCVTTAVLEQRAGPPRCRQCPREGVPVYSGQFPGPSVSSNWE
jgi:hypothetical protein